jgi:hypothetical protein
MNSESKQCPLCKGKRVLDLVDIGLGRPKCEKCKGTGVVSSPDPTTAGSEPPAVSSRRRSLPALVKLHERVLTAFEEAQDNRDAARNGGNGFLITACQIRVDALAEVQMWILEAMSEEPEGNNELRSGHE